MKRRKTQQKKKLKQEGERDGNRKQGKEYKTQPDTEIKELTTKEKVKRTSKRILPENRKSKYKVDGKIKSNKT